MITTQLNCAILECCQILTALPTSYQTNFYKVCGGENIVSWALYRCSLTFWTKIIWKTPLGICSIHCTALTLSWSLIYKLNVPFSRLLLGGPVFPAASMKLPAFRHVMYTRERLGGAPTRKQGMQNILKWPSRVPKLKGSLSAPKEINLYSF